MAGATTAGIKTRGGPDLGILFSEEPCVAAGMFTTNRIKAAPVLITQRHIADGKARAIVVNSGCANACTGDAGLEDAAAVADKVARQLDIAVEEVIVASTGVIGRRLPMESILSSMSDIELSKEGGHDLARAIMTTDTQSKEVAVAADGVFTIGGAAKGSGMIHPNMGTLLVFLTTDAAVERSLLEGLLREAVDRSFNMVTIDGDTSPNDAVILLANGTAGGVTRDGGGVEAFEQALNKVCNHLARLVAGDGEGASKLIEVTVDGARTVEDARTAARTIAGSPLVKSAVHGCDPNWGRIVAALGRSGAEFDESKMEVFLNRTCLVEGGVARYFDEDRVRLLMSGTEVSIGVSLRIGDCTATAWGCDLSAEYVNINSEYTT